MFNTICGPRKCSISDKTFENWLPLGFFLNANYKLPVCPGIALQEGFTMNDDEFLKLANQIDMYRSFATKK
jgi:hypothetical protein